MHNKIWGNGSWFASSFFLEMFFFSLDQWYYCQNFVKKEGRKFDMELVLAVQTQLGHCHVVFHSSTGFKVIIYFVVDRPGRDLPYCKLHPMFSSMHLVLKALRYSDLQCIYKASLMYYIQAIYHCPSMFHTLAVTGYIKWVLQDKLLTILPSIPNFCHLHILHPLQTTLCVLQNCCKSFPSFLFISFYCSSN